MTFLNPAILFGLIAAAIPVLIHLLNLKKLKRVEFSTLSFLKELQKTKIKRIKLKQWILLALRILIILLLVTAFARPTVKNISIGGSSSAAKTTAVIIIDNSFSMSLISERGSYFNMAKAAAKSLLNNFQEGDEAALILTSDLSGDEIKPSTNLSLIQKQIDDASISDFSGMLNDALIKAAKILSESKNFNKEIYIFSDLQKTGVYTSKNELFDLSKIFDLRTRLYYFDFTKKNFTNLAVADFTVDNQIFEKGSTISFTSAVTNYSLQTVNNTIASLYLNGKRRAQQAVNLNAGETQKITFETTLEQTGLVEAEVQLEDDDILNDNKRFTAIFVPEKINVLILAQNQEDSRFIRLALSGVENVSVTEKNSSQSNSLDYLKYDVVFIIGTEGIADIEKINSFIQNGGGVVIFPSAQNSLESYKSFCERLNIGLPLTAAGNLNSYNNSTSFDRINFEHPLFSGLFQESRKRQINSPEIYYYFKIDPQGKGNTIISLIDNSAFLSEYKFFNGKIVLFNCAPALGWTNFPLKSIFPPLINKIVFYLSSKTKAQSQVIAGQPIAVDIRGNILPQIKVVKPNSPEEIINMDSLRNKNFINYRKTDTDGIYKFYSGSKLLDFAAVNFDPRESINKYLTNSEFEDYLKEIKFSGRVFNLSIDGDFSKSIYQSRFGSELWKYFIIAALVAALTEMLVSKSSKKDMAEVG